MADPHSKCWAKDVSPCKGGMSGEHLISRGTFLDDTIKVGGLPGFGDGQRTVSINRLTAKCLCRKHNTDLSALDQALIDLVNALRECHRLQELRRESSLKRHRTVRLVVDGQRIERCVLKMLMNMAYVHRKALDGWTPPREVPGVIFGLAMLPADVGLAQLMRVGDVVQNQEATRFLFGREGGTGAPKSVMLQVHGTWRFICSWGDPVSSLPDMVLDDEFFAPDEQAIFHPNRYSFNWEDKDLGIHLDFDWTGQWNEKKHRKIVQLRQVYRSPPRGGATA